MAIAEKNVKKSSSSKYVDFDEFIDFQLKKTRSGIHHTDVLTAVVVLAVVLLGYLLVFTLFDHWLIPGGLSDLSRTFLLTGVASFSVGWIAIKIVLPLYREVNVLYAAREIEETYPEMKDSLLSWVQLRAEGREIPQDILKALEKRTALEIQKSNVDLAVDRRFLMKSSYVLLGIVVCMCLYTVFSPKKLSNSVWRALVPASRVSASTKTEILEVLPGDYELLAYDQLDVSVDLGGVIPEQVHLLFSTTDKRFVDEPLSMANTGEGLPRFRTRLTGINGEGLLKDLTYRIEAGDAVSETFHVRIKQPPSATVTEIAYEYPSYMLLDNKVQQGSTIDAWEGVYVTVRAQSNMPVKSAQLFRSDHDIATETADVIPMTKTSSDQFEARWRLKFRDDGTFANYYFLQVQNEAGEKDPRPTIHRLKIRPDLNPEIAILYPREDLNVPANAGVPIAFEARDPDFMLRRVLLKMERSGELLPNIPRLFDGPETPEVRSKYQLDLKPFSLKAGDQLQFFLEAEDNFEPFDQLTKHVTRTSKVTINIIEPVTKEQAEELTRQQEDQLQNQLQESPQPPQRQDQQRPADPAQPKEELDPANPNQQPQNPQPELQGEDPNQSDMPPAEQMSKEGDQDKPGHQGENSKPSSPQATKGNQGENSQTGGESKQNTPQSEPSEAPTDSTSENAANRPPQDPAADSGNQSAETPTNQRDGKAQKSRPNGQAEDDEALERLLKWSRENANKDDETPKSPETNSGTDSDKNETKSPPENGSDAGSGTKSNPKDQSDHKDNGTAPQDPTKNQSEETSPPPTQQPANAEKGTASPDSKSSTGESPRPEKMTGSPSENQDSEVPPNESLKPASEKPNMKPDSPRTDSGKETPSETPPSSPTQESEKSKPPMNGEDNPAMPQDGDAPTEKPTPPKPQDAPQNSKEKGPEQNLESVSDPMNPEMKRSPEENSDPKTGEMKPDAGAPGEAKPGETDSSDTMPGDAKPGDAKPGDPKPSDAKPGDAKPGDAKPGDAKPGDAKPGDAKPGDAKPGDAKPGDAKPGDAKPGDAKPGDAKPGDAKPSDAKPSDTKPGDAKPSDAKPSDAKPGDAKPGDAKPSDAKPSDAKPGDAKPGDAKPGDAKPGDAKPGDAKPGDAKPGDAKPGDAKPGDAKPGDAKPGDAKPGDAKPGDAKPGDAKPGDAKPGDAKPEDPQSSDAKTGDSKTGDEKSGDAKPSDSKPGDAKSGDSKSGGEGAGEGEGGESKPGGAMPGDGQGPGGDGEAGMKSGPGGTGGTKNSTSPNSGNASRADTELTPEEINLQNKKKSVDLALKKLRDQLERGETPDQLLEELGFSENDLSSFMQRLEERLADPKIDRSADSEAARKQFESLLKGIDYESTGERRDGGVRERQASESFGGSNRPVPPEYRNENEAYKKRLSRQGTGK